MLFPLLWKSSDAEAVLDYAEVGKKMMQERGDAQGHDPMMDAPVETSTGYMEDAAQGP